MTECLDCEGGLVYNACLDCKGEGFFVEVCNLDENHTVDCDVCDVTGDIALECDTCDGTGDLF